MKKEQSKDEITFIAKALIGLNAKIDFERDCAELDSNDIDHIAEQIGEELYNKGYRKLAGEENEVLTDAVDATFRGAVLRFAEKLKGRIREVVFISKDEIIDWDILIDETAKRFLESET